MSENSDLLVEPGRPIRLEPTPPGFWMTLLGVFAAVLAPLFGFLVGSTMGRPEGDPFLSPLYWGLFIGVVIGGLGVVAAVIGGRRLWLNVHREDEHRDDLLREDRLRDDLLRDDRAAQVDLDEPAP